jgi:hypothetical protein
MPIPGRLGKLGQEWSTYKLNHLTANAKSGDAV